MNFVVARRLEKWPNAQSRAEAARMLGSGDGKALCGKPYGQHLVVTNALDTLCTSNVDITLLDTSGQL